LLIEKWLITSREWYTINYLLGNNLDVFLEEWKDSDCQRPGGYESIIKCTNLRLSGAYQLSGDEENPVA
jgi:hypothetical protein